jgi:hypothetical protein
MNIGIRSVMLVLVAVVRIRYDGVVMIFPSLFSKVQGSTLITTFAGKAVGFAATAPGEAEVFAVVGPAVGEPEHAVRIRRDEETRRPTGLATPFLFPPFRVFDSASMPIRQPPKPSNAFLAAPSSAFAFSS